ncbi:unnamed protein product [Diamesa hyperborea]
MSTNQKLPMKIAPRPSTSGTASGSKLAQTADGKYVIIQNSGAAIPLKVVGQRGNIIQIKKPAIQNSSDESPVSPQPVKRIFVKGSASSITIGKKPDGSIKMLSPTKAPNTNLHTVNIPGKGMQIVRLLNPGASSSSATTIVSPKAETVQQPRVIVQSRGGQTLTVLSPGQRQQQQQQQIQRPSTSTGAPRILNQSLGNFQTKSELNGQRPVQIIKKTISSPTEGTPPPNKKTKFITLTTSQISQIQGATIMGGGKKPKRPCNCTKSQCLKFYCECFAAGEYCSDCNCKDCCNEGDSEERQKAIKMCIDRNPFAFKSKKSGSAEEQQRLHQRGCNCKRSGCLKNYCECYEAKIGCSANCRCLGCKNVDDIEEKMEMELQYLKSCGNKRGGLAEDMYEKNVAALKKVTDLNEIVKKPYNFMTQDVIEATVQCMIAQAEECQKMPVSKKQAEKMILEEFGRCLVEIIEFSAKNID